MLTKLSFICLLCISCATPAKELVFSHSGHPASKTVLIPLLRQVYGELGYQLTFQEAEGARALQLLNDGLVDGDVARLAPLLRSLDSTLPVVLLDTVQVVLYCRQSLPCDDAVLQNPKQRILVPTQDATLQLLTNDIQAKRYFNSDWNNIIVMFNGGKVDYLLWIESDLLQAPALINANKTAATIGPFQLYHLLHKQHQPLAEQVSRELSKRLQNTY